MEIVNCDDAKKMQYALDLISKWAEEWQLSVSVSKCNLLTLGRSLAHGKYYISDNELPCCTQCRDLGVIINSDLTTVDHIQQITVRAHQRANNILRCFVSGNISLLLIGSSVSCVCTPGSRIQLCSVVITSKAGHYENRKSPEAVYQKRLRGYRHMSYVDRLAKLGLPSLELRRLHLDLIYCYKVVFGLVKLKSAQSADMFEISSVSY